MILINFFLQAFNTNNEKFTLSKIDYLKLFNILNFFKQKNLILSVKLINEYFIKFYDYELIIYINAIIYINKNYKYVKTTYKNIYKLIMYQQNFIKNINIYINLYTLFINYIKNIINIISFNIK